MVARLLLLLALILPLPAAAQSVPGALAGSWALQVGEATIFRFDIAPVPDDDEWRGAWVRPSRFASNGESFNRIQLPEREVKSMAGLVDGDVVEISFPDPRPGAIPDIFRFRLIDSDAVEMTYVGTGLAPYLLNRVRPGAPLGPFREGATYSVRPREAPRTPKIDAEDVLDLPDASAAPEDTESFRLPPSGVIGR
jgi:hypothetical protein